MAELDSSYDPSTVEERLYGDWVDAGLFHAEPDDPGEPYSIVIPPPNVTGSLHIGHAITMAIEDAMIRRARMEGKNAVWIPGMDHAGIATQNVVERELADEGLTRHDLGREAFTERVWEWVEEYGGVILDQLRKLGSSLDWEREAFTFDEPRSRAVREVFVTLWEQGLLYRGNRLINWCPRCHTALSDIEVDHEDTAGTLTHIRYPAADGGDGVVVATTRPETMLGDTGVAVHPDDERYSDLVGRTLVLPLMDREIPVVADEAVEAEFGTGAVKVTPAHDETDFQIGERHGLEVVDIMTDEAHINDNGGRFAGMDRYEARAAVVEALRELDLIVGTEDHEHSVGHCSRCGTVVEPRLSDQWFVSVQPLAEKAIAAVEEEHTVFSPPRFTRGFLDWLRNLHDWCISRQIWWGHRIPAWYCPDGHITVAREDPTECAECGKDQLDQDEDVLDTWFSSQLWPFTVFGWPEQTRELETWYPTTVLETGYDINTFWVSRMLMAGLHFMDDVPFRVVHNHGMVRDATGKKMSKSFGNVIDPLEFIDRYGADALRFALLQHSTPGQDVPLAEEWVEGSRRFANKLWNATRFALSNLEDVDDRRGIALPDDADLALEDRWVLSRLEHCRAVVDEATESPTFHWARAADAMYHFAWDEFADWYVEAAKVRLYGDDEAATDTARAVLGVVLDDLLRLLHPFIPFVTEELWRALTGAEGGRDSLMIADWPTPRRGRDEDAEDRFAIVQDVITQLRRFRSDHEIAPSKRLEVAVVSERRDVLEPATDLLVSLGRLSSLSFAAEGEEADEAAGVTTVPFVAGDLQVPLAGTVDIDAELERLDKELDNARSELARAEGKLANDGFVANAPEDIVQAERGKRDDWQRRIEAIGDEIDRFEALR